jgi:hypothetical protein
MHGVKDKAVQQDKSGPGEQAVQRSRPAASEGRLCSRRPVLVRRVQLVHAQASSWLLHVSATITWYSLGESSSSEKAA